MTRRFTYSLLIAFMMLVVLIPITNAQAQPGGPMGPPAPNEAGGDMTPNGLGGAKGFVDGAAINAGFDTTKNDPVAVAGALVNTFLSLIGIVFIILIIFAGFKWMTAGGNEEQVTKAKTTIMNSVIGIAVVMGAFVLYKFIEGIL